jgi:hypothetical protein
MFLGFKEFTYTDKTTKEEKRIQKVVVFDPLEVKASDLNYKKTGRFSGFKFGEEITLDITIMAKDNQLKEYLDESEAR